MASVSVLYMTIFWLLMRIVPYSRHELTARCREFHEGMILLEYTVERQLIYQIVRRTDLRPVP